MFCRHGDTAGGDGIETRKAIAGDPFFIDAAGGFDQEAGLFEGRQDFFDVVRFKVIKHHNDVLGECGMRLLKRLKDGQEVRHLGFSFQLHFDKANALGMAENGEEAFFEIGRESNVIFLH